MYVASQITTIIVSISSELITSTPGIGVRVLWSTSLYDYRFVVCPLSCLNNHTSKFRQIFCTCYLWQWSGSSLTAMQYVAYFRLCVCHIMERIGQNQRPRVCFVEYARWRHRGEVCRLLPYLFTMITVGLLRISMVCASFSDAKHRMSNIWW